MKERNASLDLLRILAMFMIITSHFFGWGGAVNSLTTSDFNYLLAMPVYFVCGIGNTLFFLLAGFFAGKPKAEKALFIERKTCFYSFLITLIVFIVGINSNVGLEYTIKSFFPVIFNKYWFISVYLVLYMLSFLLVPGLESLTKGQFLIVIVALLINNTCVMNASYTLLEGLLAYMIGYYLKKFRPYENVKKRWIAFIYVAFMALYVIERFIVRHFGIEHSTLDEGLRYTLLLVAATALFAFFAKLEVKWKWPSAIAGNVLAVYLISANPAIVQPFYGEFLRVVEFSTQWWFMLYYLGVNVLIFALCVAIDKLVTMLNQKEVSLIKKIFKKKETITEENSVHQ